MTETSTAGKWAMYLPESVAGDAELIETIWRESAVHDGWTPTGDPTWTLEQPVVDELTDEDGNVWPQYPIVRVVGPVSR